MTQLTVQISDPLAQQLTLLATEQKKSVEQVVVERLESSLRLEPRRGSAAAILAALRSTPPVDSETVDELEKAIESGHLPATEKGIFDEREN